jgi:putative photosynthetic complex assembly protein 2
MAVVLGRLAAPPAAEGRMVHTRETAARVALRSLVVVVAFWWMATGVIFALERSPLTRLLGLLVATALAAWGARTVVRERDAATPRGVRHSFLGAAFLWSWVQVAFYGGWLVGPAARMVPVPAEGPSWSLAVRAVLAMLWYQLAMLAVLGGVGAATAGRRNRAGWWALLVFWGTHQLASIHIVLGVENPGRGFFPAPLAFLESYFGAARSTWFLPLSVAAILAFTLRCVVHGLRDATPDRRQGMLLLAVLGTLGVLELSVLAMPASLPLWEAFLTVRGY